MPPKRVPPMTPPTVIVRKKRVSTVTSIEPQKTSVKPPPVQHKVPSSLPLTLPTVPAQTAEELPAQEPRQPNRKQRAAQARRALLMMLREHWPQVFPWDFRQRKPLALGIHQAIAPHFPGTPVWRIKQAIALFQYEGGGAYLRAVLKGGPRYDLDGQPSGVVTAAEQEQAKRDLEAVLARRHARRVVAQPAVTPSGRPEAASPAVETEGRHG